MTTIYVYSGAGACKSFLPFLPVLFDKMKLVENFDFLERNEHKSSDILFIGGGRGSYMLDNLSQKTIRLLKSNIHDRKIRYIGICCGAYLASREILFDGVKHDTIGLCDVVSIGPYCSKNNSAYDYSIDNSTMIANRVEKGSLLAYLSGGGWFTHLSSDFVAASYYENSCLPNTIINNQMFLTHLHIEHPDTDPQFVRMVRDFVYG